MASKTNSNSWWPLALSGVLTTLFGLAALFWPGLTLATFVVLFSAYVLAIGVIAIIRGLMSMSDGVNTWWLEVLLGVLAVGVGVYLTRHPGASFATIILFLGFSLIINGVVDIVRALFGGSETATGKMLGLIMGGLAVVAGVFVFMQPVSSGVAFVWIIGLFSLLSGPMMVAASLDLKKLTT